MKTLGWTARDVLALRDKWSQLEFAVRLGVSLSSVCAWEQGRKKPSKALSAKLDRLHEILIAKGARKK